VVEWRAISSRRAASTRPKRPARAAGQRCGAGGFGASCKMLRGATAELSNARAGERADEFFPDLSSSRRLDEFPCGLILAVNITAIFGPDRPCIDACTIPGVARADPIEICPGDAHQPLRVVRVQFSKEDRWPSRLPTPPRASTLNTPAGSRRATCRFGLEAHRGQATPRASTPAWAPLRASSGRRALVEIQSQGIFTLLRYASQAAPKVADSDVSSAGAYRREPR
jgi:hypothetical protein